MRKTQAQVVQQAYPFLSPTLLNPSLLKTYQIFDKDDGIKSAYFNNYFFFKVTVPHCVVQAGPKLLGCSYPPVSAFPVAGTTVSKPPHLAMITIF